MKDVITLLIKVIAGAVGTALILAFCLMTILIAGVEGLLILIAIIIVVTWIVDKIMK